jgi:hypothetical protein
MGPSTEFPDRIHRRLRKEATMTKFSGGSVSLDHIPLIYTFNLAGYRPSALPAGQRGRYTLAGFTDATFDAMRVLESGGKAGWPF